MALSPDKKQEIIDRLAKGESIAATAEAVGCGTSTVKRMKGDPKNAPLLQAARALVATNRIYESADSVTATVTALQDRSPLVEDGLWTVFNGLTLLFSQAAQNIDPAEITVPQAVALARAAASISESYANFTDRAYGLEAIGNEIEKITSARTTAAGGEGGC